MSTAITLPDAGLAEAAAATGKLSRRRGLGVGLSCGIAIITLAVLATIFVRLANVGSPDKVELLNELLAPSAAHPFGTDALGRDVLVRTVYATGLDLQVGLVTTILPLAIGMVLGLLAGFFGGWVDAVVMRAMDALLAFPFIVLIISFVAIFGVGLTGVYVGLTVASVPVFARLTRGEMLVLRE